MILFSNYCKYYNGNLIIQAPTLELAHNLYWLKGENGCGKTTLMRSIAGIIPFNGSISVNGIEIHKKRMDYRMSVNYTEAEPVYPSFLTGNDLIRFYARAKKASEKQVSSLIDIFNIGDYANNKTGTYSSGMTKKLSLVLGFIGHPRLILLDEPLITLDQQSVMNLQKLIGSCFSEGISFMITSHQEIILENPLVKLGIVNKSLGFL